MVLVAYQSRNKLYSNATHIGDGRSVGHFALQLGMCACLHFRHVGCLARAMQGSSVSLYMLSAVISALCDQSIRLQHGRPGQPIAARVTNAISLAG